LNEALEQRKDLKKGGGRLEFVFRKKKGKQKGGVYHKRGKGHIEMEGRVGFKNYWGVNRRRRIIMGQKKGTRVKQGKGNGE